MTSKNKLGIIALATLFLLCTVLSSYAEDITVVPANSVPATSAPATTTTSTPDTSNVPTTNVNGSGNSATAIYYLEPTPAAKPKAKPVNKGTFIFDPKALRWYAYDASGKLVRSGRASGGKKYCPDIRRRCTTPVGKFVVYRKGGPGCKSSKYPIHKPGAPMPYCMFFRGGFAIHGSNDVPNYNASHGCIRVTKADAYWLSHSFIQNGTVVIVKPYR